jgi:putative oxidoreductase
MMRGIAGIDPGWGVTAVRIATGFIFLFAGYQKLAGGLNNVAEAFARMGIPVPGVAGPFIAILELVGGAALVVGLWSRWFGLLFALEFVVATFYVKMPSQGWNGSRLDLMLLVAGLLLFLAGSGKAAVDEFWHSGRRGA